MFGKPFYHYTFRKLVASFGAIFADIFVIKRGANGKEVERIKVPLAYGPAEKYLVRTSENPDLRRSPAIKLPRMSFEIKSIAYDSQRKLNTIKTNIAEIDQNQNQVLRQYQGVPYTISIELSILSKYIDDANQIIEQILPWFTPAFTITIKSIPNMNYKDDVPITLTSINLQDNYEDGWTTRRDIIWTLNFDLKTVFYGPVVPRDVITRAITDVYNASGADLTDDSDLQTIARTGRATVEITPESATFVDDFGFVEKFEGFFDGRVRDPQTGQDVIVRNILRPMVIESKGKILEPRLK